MAIIEGRNQPRSGAENTDHGSLRTQDIRAIVSGKGGSKAIPETRRGGHDHRQGPGPSEGEAAMSKVRGDLRKRG